MIKIGAMSYTRPTMHTPVTARSAEDNLRCRSGRGTLSASAPTTIRDRIPNHPAVASRAAALPDALPCASRLANRNVVTAAVAVDPMRAPIESRRRLLRLPGMPCVCFLLDLPFVFFAGFRRHSAHISAVHAAPQ